MTIRRSGADDINGVSIVPPQKLRERAIELDPVLLAIPSLTRSRRRQIVEGMREFEIPVLRVPSMEEIASGSARIDAVRPVQVEELLGRDVVPPDPALLGPGIRGASICVSGAAVDRL